jgi:hypothetical protein
MTGNVPKDDSPLLTAAREVRSLMEQLQEALDQAAATRAAPTDPIDASWHSWLESLHADWFAAIERMKVLSEEARPIVKAADNVLDTLRPHYLREFLAGRREKAWRVDPVPVMGLLLEAAQSDGCQTTPTPKPLGRHASYRKKDDPLLPLTASQQRVFDCIKTQGPVLGGVLEEATGVAIDHIRKWCDERGTLGRRGVVKVAHEGYVWRGNGTDGSSP